MGRLSDLIDSLQTGIRGYGEGATLGLVKYPQAALNTLVNGGTYENSLNQIRTQNQDMAQNQPLAYYSGQGAGGVALGILTGGYGKAPAILGKAGKVLNAVRANSGSKVLNPILTNAGMGAVEGATQNQYTTPGQALQDAIEGGAVGGAVGATGELVRLGLKKVGSNWVKDVAIPTLKDKNAVEATAPEVIKGLKTFPNKEIATGAFKGTMQDLKDIGKGTLKDAAYGAGVGALGAGVMGSDVSNGAMYGAGASVALGKREALENLVKRGADAVRPLIARNPLWVSTPLRVGTNTVAPELAGTVVNATSEQPVDWSQYTAQHPETEQPVDWSQYTTK